MYFGFDPFSSYYWSLLIFSFGFILSMKLCDCFKISYKFSIFLYVWHSIFCFIYFWFILNYGGDSINYYLWGINSSRDGFWGTGFVVKLTALMIDIGFSFIDCFLFHNLIGYLGLLAFSGSIFSAIKNKEVWVRILGISTILLPSVSFWSSGLGKDSLAFMAAGFALWAALNLSKRKFLLIFSIALMILVRPHVGFLLLVSFVISLIFDKNVKIYSKIFLSLSSFFILLAIIPFLLKFIGLEEAGTISEVDAYVDQRQSYNLDGGSSVDIANMILPMQMFTYLFRPLPFEANSLFALLASADNIILILLFCFGLFSFINKNKASVDSNRIFLWTYFYLSLITLAMTTANLGIAMRQKWMFVPFAVFLLLSIINTKKLASKKA